MALIRCEECGREISDKASFCTGCGTPVTDRPKSAEPAKKAEESLEYFILVNDREQGPYNMGQLKSLWLAGQIHNDTHYACPGMTEWKPFSTILKQVSVHKPSSEPPMLENNDSPAHSLGYSLPPKVTFSSKTEGKEKGFTRLLLVASGIIALIMGGVLIDANSDPDAERKKVEKAAYMHATNFVYKSFPGIQKVSSFQESKVFSMLPHSDVELVVDALNTFGGPVRRKLIVEMEKGGKPYEYSPNDTWRLKDLREK